MRRVICFGKPGSYDSFAKPDPLKRLELEIRANCASAERNLFHDSQAYKL